MEISSQAQHPTNPSDLSALFAACLRAREDAHLTDPAEAVCWFNGYTEGLPGLVVNRFANTIVISNHARDPRSLAAAEQTALDYYSQFQLTPIILKRRNAADEAARRGVVMLGSRLADRVLEDGIKYALDLQINQDESFYLDTRNLRRWLKTNCAAKSVLNCFAYTGSLGIAALAGGAARVVQTDLEPRFLKVAEHSARLNKFRGMRLLPLDYFKAVSRFKQTGELFDCVIVDPSIFSSTHAGTVDLLSNWLGVLNKARPLVGHEGCLILINNALFASGEAVMTQIQTLVDTGYYTIETLVDVPPDVTGFPHTRRLEPPSPTTPFNHPTKITILRVSRKDGRRASDTFNA